SGNIELIYINPETIQDFKGLPSAKEQVRLLTTLLQAKPKSITYDFNISEVSGDIHDLNAWESKMVDHKNIFVAGRIPPLKGEENNLYLKPPLERVILSPAPKTTDSVNFAKDGVTRRMILTYQNDPLLPVKLAAPFNPEIQNLK